MLLNRATLAIVDGSDLAADLMETYFRYMDFYAPSIDPNQLTYEVTVHRARFYMALNFTKKEELYRRQDEFRPPPEFW